MKFREAFFSICLLCFVLSGCSEKINESPQNFSLVQGSKISAEKALKIKIYREFAFRGFLRRMPINIDGNWIANIPVRKSIVVTLEPGTYQFDTIENSPKINITGEKNQIYFLEMYLSFSLASTFKLRLVDNKKGTEDSEDYSTVQLTYLNKDLIPVEDHKVLQPKKNTSSPAIKTKKAPSPEVPGFFTRHPIVRYFGILLLIDLVLLYVAIQIYIRVEGPFSDVTEMVFMSLAFTLAVFAIGSVVPLFTYQWIPRTIFYYHIFICFVIGAVISFFSFLWGDNEWGIFAGGIFLFSLIAFYLGVIPLKIVLHFFLAVSHGFILSLVESHWNHPV